MLVKLSQVVAIDTDFSFLHSMCTWNNSILSMPNVINIDLVNLAANYRETEQGCDNRQNVGKASIINEPA